MIHQYKENGYYMVLDIHSGLAYVVEDMIHDMASFIEPLYKEGIKDAELLKAAVLNCNVVKHKETEVSNAVDEILELAEKGILFEEYSVFDSDTDRLVIKTLHLKAADYEIGRKSLDFLVQNSGSNVNLEVNFYGSESVTDLQVMTDLVGYARSLGEVHHKKFYFTSAVGDELLNADMEEE